MESLRGCKEPFARAPPPDPYSPSPPGERSHGSTLRGMVVADRAEVANKQHVIKGPNK